MRLEEAFEKLGLEQGASVDEAKKKFRELAKKYHPDNKETGSEAKFKEINQAFSCVQNGQGDEPEMGFGGPGVDFGHMWSSENIWHIFNNMGGPPRQQRQVENVRIKLHISFKESVFGCKKEIKYSRNIKCTGCNGAGGIPASGNCQMCHGAGTVTQRRGPMIIQQTCPKCMGMRGRMKPCSTCNESGSIRSETTSSVTIPPGIKNNNALRIAGMGNFVEGNMHGEVNSDVYIEITVIQDSNFSLKGNDVISKIDISLLEALEGCEKNIDTLDGKRLINIPKLCKNKDEVVIPNMGVARIGDQKVRININYPENCEKLISYLKSE